MHADRKMTFRRVKVSFWQFHVSQKACYSRRALSPRRPQSRVKGELIMGSNLNRSQRTDQQRNVQAGLLHGRNQKRVLYSRAGNLWGEAETQSAETHTPAAKTKILHLEMCVWQPEAASWKGWWLEMSGRLAGAISWTLTATQPLVAQSCIHVFHNNHLNTDFFKLKLFLDL